MSDNEQKVEVPIVQEEFANFLRKYRVAKAGEMCDTVAENIGETGGADVFENPELLAKGLGTWSEYIGAPLRKQILQHWFAKKHIEVGPEAMEVAGITPKTEAVVQKKKEAAKKTAEGTIWTVDVDDRGMPKIRMIKDAAEPGTTLEEATRAAKEIAKDYSGEEALVIYNETLGRHMPNTKADFVKKNLAVAWAAAKQMDEAMAEGTPADPMEVFVEQMARLESLKETMGMGKPEPKGSLGEVVSAIKDLREMSGSEGKLPNWLSDPVSFQQTIQALTPTGDSDALKTLKEELTKVREDMHQTELAHKTEQIVALVSEIQSYRTEVSSLKADMEQNRNQSGRNPYDLLSQTIEKLDKKIPDKEDIKAMLAQTISKGAKLAPRGIAERGKALEGMVVGMETAAEVKAIEDNWWHLS